MGPVVLDSSVVLGLLLSGDPHHQRVRRELSGLEGQPLVVSAITYAEVMVGAVRDEAARGNTDRFWQRAIDSIEPVTKRIAHVSAELRAATPSLKLPDALIVATGEVLGAEAVLTTDARWSGVTPRVRVLGA